MAEKGDIRCFTAVYLTAEHASGCMEAGNYTYDRMIGLLQLGMHDLLVKAAETKRSIPLGDDS